MKQKIISVVMPILVAASCVLPTFAVDSIDTQYLKQDYLDIVSELNEKYQADVQLEFKASGDYVSASEMPSPEEYKEQLSNILQAQERTRQAMAAEEARVMLAEKSLPTQTLASYSSTTGTATQSVGFDNLIINYSASNISGRWLFTVCNSYEFKHSILFPEYTFLISSKDASVIDSGRTIYAWAEGSLVYMTATYQQVIGNYREAGEFYMSASGSVTSRSLT